MKRLLFFICTLLCANVIMAQTTFWIGDIQYEVTSTNPAEVEVNDANTSITTAVIPSTVSYGGITYTVTSIGDDAFSSCWSLTSVTIPNSVTSIGDDAFSSCWSLTSVTIPNSVTSIGNFAFAYCWSLTSITCLAETAPSLDGNRVFHSTPETKGLIIPCGSNYSNYISWIIYTDWLHLECIDVYLGNSLTYFPLTFAIISEGERTMKVSDCDESATDVEIPARVMYNGELYTVTSIGNQAFWDCSSLTSVTIPNSVTSIGNAAFYHCSGLTSIDIPNSVTSIGNDAFWNCWSLTSVTIPNSVTSIGNSAFMNCSSLTSVNIPNSVTSIGGSAFFYCSSLTSVTIPNSVISIGNEAFYHCSSLTSVTIGNSVTSIGDYAFTDCSSLTSVTIGNSVNTIGNGAFSRCSSLTSVDIPNSVNTIGNSAFYGCSSLTSVTIGNSVTSIGNSVTSIGARAFASCNDLTSVIIGNSVTSIGDYAFYANSLTSVTCLAETAPSLGSDVFNSTPSTKTLTVHCGSDYSSWESATTWASVECIDIYVYLGNSLTYFPLTFAIISEEEHTMKVSDCDESATVVEIPARVMYNGELYDVTSIGYEAFSGCSSLDSVTCLAETAPSLGSAAFSGAPSTKTLTVPFGSNYSAWEEASTWQKIYYLIQEGEEKELASDFTITEVRKIKNEGVLRIKPTGQLINETSTNVSGVFEIETPTLANDKWSFVGAPFNGYKLEAIKEGTRDVAVSVFDYDSADWSEEFATIETPIRKGEGFLLWSFAEEATVFTTNPENPSEEYTLNNGGVSVTETLTTHEGGGNWMALANPYTFKLDIAKFLQDQNDVKGGFVYRLNGVSWEEVSEGVIGLTEGFFVNYDNPGSQTATFVKSHRYTGSSSKAEKKKEYIKLYMNDGERTSKLSIAQNEEASQGDDIFDANKLFSPFEIAEPYFLTEGVALVKEEVKTLPYTATLNVKSYESKEVTFSVGDIPEDYNVYLIDNGFDIKMNDGVEYNTRIVAGENADRFKFVIKKAHRLTETVNKDIYVNNFNREVRISSTQKDLKIEVYDALGRKVFETKDYKFELNQVPAGAYMVKVYNRFARKDAKIVLH